MSSPAVFAYRPAGSSKVFVTQARWANHTAKNLSGLLKDSNYEDEQELMDFLFERITQFSRIGAFDKLDDDYILRQTLDECLEDMNHSNFLRLVTANEGAMYGVNLDPYSLINHWEPVTTTGDIEQIVKNNESYQDGYSAYYDGDNPDVVTIIRGESEREVITLSR